MPKLCAKAKKKIKKKNYAFRYGLHSIRDGEGKKTGQNLKNGIHKALLSAFVLDLLVEAKGSVDGVRNEGGKGMHTLIQMGGDQ